MLIFRDIDTTKTETTYLHTLKHHFRRKSDLRCFWYQDFSRIRHYFPG